MSGYSCNYFILFTASSSSLSQVIFFSTYISTSVLPAGDWVCPGGAVAVTVNVIKTSSSYYHTHICSSPVKCELGQP